MIPPAQTLEQRKRDTLNRLEHDVDAWVATSDRANSLPLTSTSLFVRSGCKHGAKLTNWRAAN